MTVRWKASLIAALAGLAALGQASRAAAELDLGVVSLAVASDRIVPGAPVSLDVVVRSTGPCVDCGPVQISYWDDSEHGNVDCSDGATLNTVAQIPAQSDVTVHVVLNGYPRPGKYRAWVWVDCQQAVAETDEANNKASVDIEVKEFGRGGQDTDSGDDDGTDGDTDGGSGGTDGGSGGNDGNTDDGDTDDGSNNGGSPPDGSSDNPSGGPDDDSPADPVPPAGPNLCGFLGPSAAAIIGWMAGAALAFAGLRLRSPTRVSIT